MRRHAVGLGTEADPIVIGNIHCAMNVELLQRFLEDLRIHAQRGLQLIACDGSVAGPPRQRLMDALELVERRVVALEEELMRAAIGIGVHQDGAAGQAIATGAADLLVIGLEAGRKRRVNDGTNIRLIDAHAERNRGDDDFKRAIEKSALHPITLIGVEARVIGGRREVRGKRRRQVSSASLRVGA